MTDEIAAEIAQINDVMRTDRGRYDADPAMQSRLTDLYQAQQTASSPPRARQNEKAQIEQIMRTDRKRYDRDQEMQARYLSLLTSQDPAGLQTHSGDSYSVDLIPMPTLSDWTKQGNPAADYTNHAKAIRETNDIITGMDEADRAEFDRSFSLLPRPVQSAALSALLDTRTAPVWPLAETAMSELGQVPAYAALISEWGHEAPRKLAVAQERLLRVVDRLSDGDTHAVFEWLNGLPKSAVVSLTRKLAR
ncbi:MAG: hypothetical protein ACU0FH_16790 [Heliomarina sp.]|uniref:hypothetical protein n=1 Tax=Heliomarina sp. TaxID=2917556 RepID=UPI0040586AAC